ncbi:guanine nucleotide-binding protein subunit gamma 3-like [Prosopis cineraria]|uniref:guanine nucleotide-binding protein subunit gamma 3-like n=1 Tax=Prosopis cineraria TaxID=364024 RepID=UPI00240FE67E|nr:guanine nucleotide-binding protein subunit gamma 3-like [Prosopis cineraria]
MATQLGRCPSVPSLPPPSPKSPPDYPDLYGKRRETARVQMLEREISFLEEELKSVEAHQPASRCCKEIADFVVANSDPLLPTNKKERRSCGFWKWLRGMACWKVSWMWCWCCEECCYGNLKWRRRCKPKQRWACSGGSGSSCCNACWSCPRPKSDCCCCIPQSCCSFQCDSCPSCCTCKCSCSCSCPKVRPCCSCTNSCCCWNPCRLCC